MRRPGWAVFKPRPDFRGKLAPRGEVYPQLTRGDPASGLVAGFIANLQNLLGAGGAGGTIKGHAPEGT